MDGNKLRIVVFGNTSKTYILLKGLARLNLNVHTLVTINPSLLNRLKLPIADYYPVHKSIEHLYQDVNVYFSNSYSLTHEDDIEFFKSNEFDIGIVMGWQRLIPNHVLQSFKVGVFGMHGSAEGLPKGRGRSPMNWALIEGRKLFHTSLFKYNEGVDEGDIVDTFVFTIKDTDTIYTLHYKNVFAMLYMLNAHWSEIVSGKIKYVQQKGGEATYYPKRKPEDSMIDWNRDIFYIDRFIRAVTKPFPGSYTYYNGTICKIYGATIFETDEVDFGWRHIQPGTIIEKLPDGKLLVKAIGGILLIYDYECDCEIRESTKFEGSPTFTFPVNEYGHHDVDYETFIRLNKR